MSENQQPYADNSAPMPLRYQIGVTIFLTVFVGVISVPLGMADDNLLISFIPPVAVAAISISGFAVSSLTRRGLGGASVARVIGVIAGALAGFSAIALGVFLIATFRPECTPSEFVTCEVIRNGVATGESASVGEQFFQYALFALAPIAIGIFILVFTFREIARSTRRDNS